MDARRRFIISLCLLIGFWLIGTIGFVIIQDAGLLEAAYVTIVTISTVGNESFDFNDSGRIFTMLLIMAGVGSMYYASVTLLVSGELRSAREKRKVQKRINELQNHVVVCGYGRVGKLVADQLHAQSIALVLIDNNLEKIAALESEGL